MRRMSDTTVRISRVRKLALACAVLVLAITSLSAFIRLSRAGLGCEPWPQCQAQRSAMTAQALAELDSGVVMAARVAHRIAASAALVLVVVMLVQAFARQPVLRREGHLALGLLGAALFLAVLGRLGGDSRQPAVVVGNLLAGFVMFALSCRLVQDGAEGAPAARRLRPWVLAALVLLGLQVALGAVVSAQHAIAQCGASPLCVVHRTGAVVVAAVLLPLGIGAWRAGFSVAGGLVVGLTLVQAALGLLLVSGRAPLALALGHNIAAAVLCAALLALLQPGPD